MTGPPHDLDAERAVLGALLSGAPLADVHPLASADFYRPAHQLIYEAITSLTGDGKPAEPVAVADELRRRGDLTRMGGGPYLHTCMAATPAAATAGYYAGIVREHSARRQLTEHADRLRQAALAPDADIAALLAGTPRARAASGRRLVLTRASDIEPEPVVWAWEDSGQGRMPSGSLGLFAGREGTGKSSFLIWMAAKVTRGELPGAFKGDPRATVYIAVEDSWKYTIVPRLMAAGADLDLVYRAEVQEVSDGTVSLSLPADNVLLEEAITSHGVALVALDPLLSSISDALDTHVNRQVRQALDPLARMADRTGAVIAGVAHFNKSAGTDASSLITASGAFKDVARFIFAFATDDGDGSKVITQTKNSLGRADLPSLAYRIIDATVPTAKGDASVGRFVLDGETDRTVRDILADAAGEERDEKTRAKDYLRKALGDGPQKTREVEEEAKQVHQISTRTLERARKDLKIPAAKHGAIWWISLPEHEGDLVDAEFISAISAKSTRTGGAGGDGGVDPRKTSTGETAP